MAKNTKQTSPQAASAASKVLRDGRTGKASKTAAGSALAQTPSKKKQSDVQNTQERRNLSMSIYEQLALLYVKTNAQPGDSPEKLLWAYREAYDKIAKCDKKNGGKPFSLE